ncbi:hypothetical protein DPMN_023630 [Dreissena polymorpha]|uniref:Uncharacterized protein n=1 Tax=Dreissena polymorpha TaxID=45954 RepID=A0A9D4LNB3_DREPO|nr:hypothetical protein DPMN_023630 [Dreissena polymorpha]
MGTRLMTSVLRSNHCITQHVYLVSPVTSRKGWMTTMKEWQRWTDRWHLGKTRTGARLAGTPPGCSCEGTTYTSYNNK